MPLSDLLIAPLGVAAMLAVVGLPTRPRIHAALAVGYSTTVVLGLGGAYSMRTAILVLATAFVSLVLDRGGRLLVRDEDSLTLGVSPLSRRVPRL